MITLVQQNVHCHDLQKEIRVLESGFHSPYDPIPDTTTTAVFQVVNFKDSKGHLNTLGHTN